MVVVVALPDLDTVMPETHGPDMVPEIVQFVVQLGALMVIVELRVLERPLASVTLIVTVWLAPAVVGVPVTFTVLLVLLESERPAGKAVNDHVYGPTPPFRVTGAL